MTIFKLDPQKFKSFKRKAYLRTLMLFPVYIIIAIVVNMNIEKNVMDNNIFFYLILVLVVSGILTVYSNKKHLDKYEALYRFKLDHERIICQQFKFNDIQILKEEISGIYSLPKGGFRITTHNQQKTLNTHPSIEDEVELRALLGNFAQIVPLNEDKRKAMVQYVVPVLAILGMVAAFSFNNPWIAVPGGLFSAGYLVYAFIVIQRNPVIGNDLKRKFYWTILPFLALLAAIYKKIFP